ncbi:VOC family protein [Elongatibacter sediminis]|uniref:VOC family protein n=1 Tax=Elongatibacter sediminis TaxID=3119006 RepID=A0AAW9R7N0_9GAMM
MDLNISEHIVMLYYRDLEDARRFYGETLGLKAVMENDWVTLFQVTPHSLIGTVKEGGAGGFHKVQDENAVMVSIATSEIDQWNERVREAGDIEYVKELYRSGTLPMSAFLVRDPGGYTVEFFQWDEGGWGQSEHAA